MVKILLLLLFIVFAHPRVQQSKPNRPSPRKIQRFQGQQIKLIEKQTKKQTAISDTTFNTYNFLLSKSALFIIKQEQVQQMKIVIDVLWRQNSIYVQASVLKEEEITLTIEDQNKSIVANRSFFTGTGLKFNLSSNKPYKISLKENGSYKKIIMMHLSKVYKPSNVTAKLKQMVVLQTKLLVVQQKLTNGLKLASTGLVMKERIDSELLKQTQTYCHFQIVEVIFILLATYIQKTMLTKLLKSDTIV